MKKVMVFGTFDKIHLGHINLFEQAKKYGDYLIVVVARDQNVKKIKGHLPERNEEQRLKEIKKENLVAKAVLGHPNNPYKVIADEKPDVICLGYDQDSYDRYLKEIFPDIEATRLKPYKPEIYKSSKLK
ncbi:adenylyltransferase/cytidyltransferase family protein [Candidatus Falkowbacteria bacterium]|nr:adenylyltransferase/cytidyltransferase family protein [Candidatus Falkowbacteria bacterium]